MQQRDGLSTAVRNSFPKLFRQSMPKRSPSYRLAKSMQTSFPTKSENGKCLPFRNSTQLRTIMYLSHWNLVDHEHNLHRWLYNRNGGRTNPCLIFWEKSSEDGEVQRKPSDRVTSETTVIAGKEAVGNCEYS